MTDDDDLKALLRRADPSAGHTPLDDARIRRLVAAAERDDRARGARARRRPRLLVTGASIGAVATAVAGVLIAGLLATPAVQAPTPPETSAACASPNVESLGEYDTAYEATVTAVDHDDVTLRVTTVFAGDPGQTVNVSQISDGDGHPVFVTGRSYLVASADGFISRCDTVPTTAALRDLYQRSFGGSSRG